MPHKPLSTENEERIARLREKSPRLIDRIESVSTKGPDAMREELGVLAASGLIAFITRFAETNEERDRALCYLTHLITMAKVNEDQIVTLLRMANKDVLERRS